MSKYTLGPSRDVNANDVMVLVVCVISSVLILASVMYGRFAQPNRETHAIKSQAVERGYAEWATDGKKIEFRWKE